MRLGPSVSGRTRRRWFGLLAAVVAWSATPVRAQVPQPIVPDINQRSGLLGRFVPIDSSLPPDPDRDAFRDTRWVTKTNDRCPNSIKSGGLYGKRWPATCTACVYPFFYGSPGRSTITPECEHGHRALRLFQSLCQPFRPVGSYYADGCYVPIHDLDPLVPGPGPYPYPCYVRDPSEREGCHKNR